METAKKTGMNHDDLLLLFVGGAVGGPTTRRDVNNKTSDEKNLVPRRLSHI